MAFNLLPYERIILLKEYQVGNAVDEISYKIVTKFHECIIPIEPQKFDRLLKP